VDRAASGPPAVGARVSETEGSDDPDDDAAAVDKKKGQKPFIYWLMTPFPGPPFVLITTGQCTARGDSLSWDYMTTWLVLHMPGL
jgi:hypothetical protein